MSEASDQAVADEPIDGALVEAVADEADAQGDETQLDEDGDPIEEADDTEEIDLEGVKYRVPKALKDGYLRQADYTRKTQEVAEARRTAEAEIQQRREAIAQQAEMQSQTLEERVQLATFDTQLEQFNGFDWADYERNYGAGAVATAMATWRQLESQRSALASSITAKEQEFVSLASAQTANALEEANAILSREIPGYGSEVVSKAWEAGRSFGYTNEELRDTFVGENGKADVRTFKLLHELATLRAKDATLTAKNTKATALAKVAAVTPAATVSAKANGYKAGVDDSLPIGEWMRRREAQAAKARGPR